MMYKIKMLSDYQINEKQGNVGKQQTEVEKTECLRER